MKDSHLKFRPIGDDCLGLWLIYLIWIKEVQIMQTNQTKKHKKSDLNVQLCIRDGFESTGAFTTLHTHKKTVLTYKKRLAYCKLAPKST